MTMIETAKAPQAQSHSGLLQDVKDLRVTFKTPDGDVTAVNDLNFTLQAGETLGIVGESGSGNSQTAFALMGIAGGQPVESGVPPPLTRSANPSLCPSVSFEQTVRWNKSLAMIFQHPMTSLNPYMRYGEQLMEVLMLHKGLSKAEAFEESVKMLDAVK
ncbi:ATP-binding cassette domain-containing protein [Klebsiella pneumoniae]|nr:ATP-binding cassette domain-containing protein [Klebsiella pneumoniae]